MMTRQHRGFTHIHPPGLSLTRNPRMEQGPFGLNPGLRTPQLPTTHARAGTGHRAQTWATSPSLASHRRIHLTRATSCRTERFIPFLEFPPEVRKIIYTTDEIVKLGRVFGSVFGLPVCDEDLVGPLGLFGDLLLFVASLLVVVGRARDA